MAGQAPAPGALDTLGFPLGPLPPLQPNTTDLQTAVARGSLGVGYSGSGLLLFYFIGVSKVLQQLGIVKPGVTPIAATSGGIIGCAPDLGLVNHDTVLKVGKEFLLRCRERNNCAGSLDEEVAKVVDQILPPNAHELANNTAFFTFASPNERGIPVGDYVSTYESRDELFEAVRTGTYLPMWSGSSLTRPFKGRRAYDGGFRRQVPCPPDVTYCITVSVLPPLEWRTIIGSLMETNSMRLLQRVIQTTLGSHPVQFLISKLAMLRYADYKMSEIVYGLASYLCAVNPGQTEIYPGRFHPNPYPFLEYFSMMLMPPSPEDVDRLVEMGQRDAMAWARHMGVLPAAGRRALAA